MPAPANLLSGPNLGCPSTCTPEDEVSIQPYMCMRSFSVARGVCLQRSTLFTLAQWMCLRLEVSCAGTSQAGPNTPCLSKMPPINSRPQQASSLFKDIHIKTD
eukprot:1150342-Pelagomonas_calceolata.AAC.12